MNESTAASRLAARQQFAVLANNVAQSIMLMADYWQSHHDDLPDQHGVEGYPFDGSCDEVGLQALNWAESVRVPPAQHPARNSHSALTRGLLEIIPDYERGNVGLQTDSGRHVWEHVLAAAAGTEAVAATGTNKELSFQTHVVQVLYSHGYGANLNPIDLDTLADEIIIGVLFTKDITWSQLPEPTVVTS
jgi:hypothetical protein